MKRLAFAIMTGVGLFLHKEWKKRQQLTLSVSRYREDEKRLYTQFKFLLSEGYSLDESRTAYSYKLEFERENHFLILMMKHPQNLVIYIIDEEGEEELLETVLSRNKIAFPQLAAYTEYDSYLQALSTVVKNYIA